MNKPTPSIFKEIKAKDQDIGAKGAMATAKKVAAGNSTPQKSGGTEVAGGWATDYTKVPKHE